MRGGDDAGLLDLSPPLESSNPFRCEAAWLASAPSPIKLYVQMTWRHMVAAHQAARLCELTLCDNLVRPVKCPRNQCASQFVSCQNVFVILGAVAIVSLALTIVMFPVSIIWVGQPLGNAALVAADAFASVFSVVFFAAFAFAMAE